ncbi:MAG: NAD(P)/FAD-dependent oxidoreductase, partial [Chitinophagia bacterium]|nr:NAD(P)/FAD-dependent oxidoreductase [Chitinophagia bacterium]
IELHYLKELPDGYLWVFPLANGRANVGVGMLSQTIRTKKIKLRELFLTLVNEHPRFKNMFASAVPEGKVEGWGIPIYTGKQAVCGDRFLLTGDAARLIDPFSGEGVGNALYSGMLAADTCRAALQTGNMEAAFLQQQYEIPLYRQLGPELEQNALMQRIFLRQWVFNLFFSKAFKSETLRNAISHMFSDAEMHKQFSKPSFYFKVLLNR